MHDVLMTVPFMMFAATADADMRTQTIDYMPEAARTLRAS